MATTRTRRILLGAAVALTLILAMFFVCGGGMVLRWLVDSMEHPPAPFARTMPPPAPDYAQSKAWLAFPGRDGLERSVPQGMTPVSEVAARADVFYLQPTTYTKRDVWNAAYDADTPVAKSVLLGQLSAFNGCCRLYAPRFRQASGAGLDDPAAMDLAYGDIRRAFRHYITTDNSGRPFIIAGHSQGAYFASRLLQDEVLGSKLKERLVAGYLVGAYIPTVLSQIGLPVCDMALSTGCIVTWNTVKKGKTGPRDVLRKSNYWWKGANHKNDGVYPIVCVNPLNWSTSQAAAASANRGSLPLPRAPFPTKPIILPALSPHLTGAVCRNELLNIELSSDAPDGLSDLMSRLFGSYHLNDIGIFYGAVRQNAIDRVTAFDADRRHAS